MYLVEELRVCQSNIEPRPQYFCTKMPGGAIPPHVGVNRTMSKNEKKNEVGSGIVQLWTSRRS